VVVVVVYTVAAEVEMMDVVLVQMAEAEEELDLHSFLLEVHVWLEVTLIMVM
jgi:hypothetical protein